MNKNVLFASNVPNQSKWLVELDRSFKELELEITLLKQTETPSSIDYLITSPGSDTQDFSPFVNLRAILNLWAGVENIINNPTIHCPLVRMNDPGMVEGMTEWVTAQVLRHHLNLDVHITNKQGKWLKEALPPLARSRTVGVLGLGVLGSACAKKLSLFHFQILGWSRTKKEIPGVTTYHGYDALMDVMRQSDIIVLLLPFTTETRDIINEKTLRFCKRGAVLINSGRGDLVDESALIRALDDGQLSHATLDVFKQEPLPPKHPFWKHQKVSVWPHISSESRPETASLSIARNIKRDLEGERMHEIVNLSLGY